MKEDDLRKLTNLNFCTLHNKRLKFYQLEAFD